MQARPRSVENRVADALNAHFKRMNMQMVERIPVLGRTGPDISINALKLVVDVKSRLEIPQTLFFPLLYPFRFGDNFELYGVRLCCLDMLWNPDFTPIVPLDFTSKIVRDYLDHMEAWTRTNVEGGVSCIILHRPKMPIGSAVAVIHSYNRRRLVEYAGASCHNAVSAE